MLSSQCKKPFQLFFRFSIPFDLASPLHQKDEIKRPFDLTLVKPEEFPEISFDPVPVGRQPDLFFHCNAKPVKSAFVLLAKEDEVGRIKSPP